MILLFLLVLLEFSQCRICQSAAPTLSLMEEMRLCRELNYPFCVEASSANLIEAQKNIDDLPADVADAGTSEPSAMAVVADRYLVQRYKSMAESNDASQTCLHYWRMAVCSEMFSLLGAQQTLCFNTCENVRKHCPTQYMTELCQATIDARMLGSCEDYATLLDDDSCVIGDSNQNNPPAPVPTVKKITPTPQPQPQPQAPIPVSAKPVSQPQKSNVIQYIPYFNGGEKNGVSCNVVVAIMVVYLITIFLERK